MSRKFLLSYPKSGSNWLMYCIQKLTNFTGISINGNLMDGQKPDTPISEEEAIIKDHAYVPKFREAYSQDDVIICLVRNYKECFMSHVGFIGDDKIEGLEGSKNIGPDYIRVLQIFDECKGKKYLIYYEDLMTDFELELRKLLDFLSQLNKFKQRMTVKEFIEELDYHKKASMDFYNTEVNISRSDGKSTIYHSKKLTEEKKNMIDNYLITNFPHLTKTLLTRFLEDQNEDSNDYTS